MLFNSLIFFIFLPITFVAYWISNRKTKFQNLIIIVASYIFYGWWSWKFLILIAFSTLCSYISGLLIEKNETKIKRRIILWGNITINLGILVIYKYYDFFVSNLKQLFDYLGFQMDDITLKLVLPVGISFYTFQALSYSIDVYRKKIAASKDPIAFFAFISFFPQLVAGPIERATNLLPQFIKKRNFDYSKSVDGCRQILWGFFKKIVIADNCGQYVNAVFGDYMEYGGLNLWMAAICFSFQIYGDFSGYSDIAIGVSKLFNINLMRNFHTPYFSRDIAEFWRKWHISLTTWFRDYIYIPLGGSRVKKSKIIRNTFVIFIVSGMWHGAEWTFLAWGVFHSVLFMPLILTGKNRKYVEGVGGYILPPMKESLLMGWTFLLVTLGWVIFRADTIGSAYHYIVRMFTNFHHEGAMHFDKYLILWIGFMIVVEWITKKEHHSFAIKGTGLMKYRMVRWVIYLSISLLCVFNTNFQSEFIYFQF